MANLTLSSLITESLATESEEENNVQRESLVSDAKEKAHGLKSAFTTSPNASRNRKIAGGAAAGTLAAIGAGVGVRALLKYLRKKKKHK